MNPHTHDYRDTVRPGEKTGSAYQSFKRSERLSPWLIVSTILCVVIVGLMMAFLPDAAPW